MAGALGAADVEGAAFGEGFATLHETVKHVVGSIIMFKYCLKSLESTLDGVAPVIQAIRGLSLALGQPDKKTKSLIKKMEEGKELVLKCSKIKRVSWRFYIKAYFYPKRFKKLNNAIAEFCQIDLTVQKTRIVLETSIMVNQDTTILLETKAKEDLVLEEVTKQNSESKKKKKFENRTLSCAPSESTSNRNENENENDIGIVLATNVIPVYSFSPRKKLGRSISPWQKGELLGSGSFGAVYEGYSEDGYFFAVKEVLLLDQGSQGKQNIACVEQEISLLKQFEHENIVQYLGTEKDESRIYIFLELVTKGSLASLYQKYHLSDSQVSAYTRQILNGLKYLHDKKVIHRDIKCANILVDASGSVKLADFGLAKVTELNDVKSSKGSPFWMAPEVVNLKNRVYGLAADIWSLGCTVLEMLTRQHPYPDLESVQALFMIGQGKPPLVPDSLSRDARYFILKCLQVDPNDRPTATQLLDHPFVTRSQNSFGPASPHNSIQL